MAKKTLNVGIIGFGFIGRVHTYALQNMKFFYDLPFEPVITHVCTSKPETAQKAQEITGAENGVTDYREITENPDIDIVHICTPNNLHKEELLSAMENGKHIYCDKPLVCDMEEASEIKKALENYSGIAQMTLQNRFFPATIRAKQLMDEGTIGEVLEFRACYLHSGSADPEAPLKWKLSKDAGGGVIADLASHIMDLMHYMMGDYSELCAETSIAYPERPSYDDPSKKVKVEAEDCVMMLARMKNGAVGTIEATKIATGTEDEVRFEIHGSKGGLRYNGMDAHHLEMYDCSDSDKPAGGVRGWKVIDCGQRYPDAVNFPGPKFSIGWMRSHIGCLANFYTCVGEGKQAEPGLKQGIYVQQLIETVRESSKDRMWKSVKRKT